MPDVHAPYHDVYAFGVACDVAATCDVGIIIGDFADCYKISSHAKDPRVAMPWEREIELVNDALDALPDIPWHYVEGNHEYRVTRDIIARAPDYINFVSYREMARIDERGFGWTGYNEEPYRLGKWAFPHDIGRCGVNAMRQSLIDFGGNLVIGHTHRLGTYYGGTTQGDTHCCLNVGWLGDWRAIGYRHKSMARREWQLGFGIVDFDGAGVGWAQAIPIIEGECVVDGVKFS